MPNEFAEDFFDIPSTLATNTDLRNSVVELMRNDEIPGKALEGGNRLEAFRKVLIALARGDIDLSEAYYRTQSQLPRDTSPHSGNNRVFAQGWAERLVRIQFSRFYNQAVLTYLRERNFSTCFVPHSSAEDSSSPCTQVLAGHTNSVDMLYERLIDAYAKGTFSKDAKIPNHPHCTHVVTPAQESDHS